MPVAQLPPGPPPRQYLHRYTPSRSSSACPIYHFALSCDFEELAEECPEFRNALAAAGDPRRRRRRRGGRGGKCDDDDAATSSTRGDERIDDDGSRRGSSIDEPDGRGGDGAGDEKDETTTTAASTASSSRRECSARTMATHSFNSSLTRCLLRRHFRIELPSLPPGRLCPPIPNRANYVCWLRELLAQSGRDLSRFSNADDAGSGSDDAKSDDGDAGPSWQRRGIDIGTGVSAIYPLLLTTCLFAGSDADASANNPNSRIGDDGVVSRRDMEGGCETSRRQWKFLATDIDPLAVESARSNVRANRLENRICVVRVNGADPNEKTDENVRKGPLFAAMEGATKQSAFRPRHSNGATGERPKELAEYPKFDFVMTNPPFYSTLREATAPRAGDKRSRTDMSANEGVYAPSANYGDRVDGRDMDDLSGEPLDGGGGDAGFIDAIMNDSRYFRRHVTWYTSLVAKRSSLDAVLKKLQTLDGVWGNRGQVRTVEFRQGNIVGGEGGEKSDVVGDERDEKNDGSGGGVGPRVRWGVGWTYERAAGRCGACRVTGGLQSFEVFVGVGDDGANGAEDEASGEVASRLIAYFEGLRDYSLKCSRRMRERARGTLAQGEDGHGKGPSRRKLTCVTAVEERFFDRGPSHSPSPHREGDNDNLPREGHFIIDAFVDRGGSRDEGGRVGVRVVLEMYGHTKRGSVAIDKIRGPLPGEIGRTNRRWRRLSKRRTRTARP